MEDATNQDATESLKDAFNAEAALRLVVEGTSAVTGASFFYSLVHYLARALQVRYAMVTQCLENPPGHVRTLALWQGDNFGENFSYCTSATPCHQVLNGQTHYYPDSIQSLFPQDSDLVHLNAKAYLGVPVMGSEGVVLGHLIIMHDQPLAPQPVGLSIMQIFAVRAGAELERQAAIEQLRYESLHDALTGLPNRTYFIERLTKVCESLEQTFVVLFLDLDRFKVINDSLGHAAGDQLLIEVSQRLAACLRPMDTVARLGGDEFAILLEEPESCAHVPAIAQRLQDSLTAVFRIDQCNVYIGVSIGIVSKTPALKRPTDYLRSADLAMYQVKRQGSGEYQIFNPQMHTQALHRLNRESALHRAINQGELEVHYQPIFTLPDKTLTGFEALLRWWCPEQQRQISPCEFIPIAEETGLIVPLGWWVIQTACYQLRTWQTCFSHLDLTMNINISNRQFEQNDIVEKVLGTLETTGINPEHLRFELTESMLMVKPVRIASIMQQLRMFGVQFYLDDFGQGSSSLSILHELPIDALKIDRTFIDRMTTDQTSLAIVKTILALADSLAISVVAEGIEAAEQLQQMVELKCHFGQGYLVSPPMSSPVATDWIERYTKGAPAASMTAIGP